MEAEVRLLAMRVAILCRRVDELSEENAALRADLAAVLVQKARPSSPYSSTTPTSETVRIPSTLKPPSR